jgi:hypothetical protein
MRLLVSGRNLVDAPRVLVAVLSSSGEHAQMVEACRKTWGTDQTDHFRVVYYYARRRQVGPQPRNWTATQDGDVITTGIDEGWNVLLDQTLMAFDHLRKQDGWDYIFRPCCGSYLDRDNLLAWIADKPRTRFYAGFDGPYQGSEWHYASGSGYFISRDLVDLLCENQTEVLSLHGSHYLDDVSVGQFLASRGVKVTHAPRIDDETTPDPVVYHWHFRIFPKKLHEVRENLRRMRSA